MYFMRFNAWFSAGDWGNVTE